MTMLAKRCGVKPDVGVMHGRLAAHLASSTTGTPISAAFCRFGHPPDELLLAVADGTDHPMLDTQADAVIAAYETERMTVTERGNGEWCVLVLMAAERCDAAS